MAERKQVKDREAAERQEPQGSVKSGNAAQEQRSSAENGNAEQEPQESYRIEEAFARIDSLIARLESPEISLEQSFQAYEEGMRLLKACNDQIDRVEKKVLAINGDGGFDELGE
ncbi:MAG: exodeoxyribonuclease VII small subunit [Clostridium sp.]|nr:exodeoxyribonuclease VII small subunit [Clostridium sp.]